LTTPPKLQLLGLQNPSHLTPMIVPKPTINSSPSCAVCRKAFFPMKRLA
jgi:hypothetical protein